MIPSYNIKHCKAWTKGHDKRSPLKSSMKKKAFEDSPVCSKEGPTSTRSPKKSSSKVSKANTANSTEVDPNSKIVQEKVKPSTISVFDDDYIGPEMMKLEANMPFWHIDEEKLEKELKYSMQLKREKLAKQSNHTNESSRSSNNNNVNEVGNSSDGNSNVLSLKTEYDSSKNNDNETIFSYDSTNFSSPVTHKVPSRVLSIFFPSGDKGLKAVDYLKQYEQIVSPKPPPPPEPVISPLKAAAAEFRTLLINSPVMSPKSYNAIDIAHEKAIKQKERNDAMAAEWAIKKAAEDELVSVSKNDELLKNNERMRMLATQRKLRTAKSALKVILDDIPIDKVALKRTLDEIKRLKMELDPHGTPQRPLIIADSLVSP